MLKCAECKDTTDVIMSSSTWVAGGRNAFTIVLFPSDPVPLCESCESDYYHVCTYCAALLIGEAAFVCEDNGVFRCPDCNPDLPVYRGDFDSYLRGLPA